MPVVLHPRLVAAACMDPTLTYMIQSGGPLTRERWIDLNYPDGPPKPWCVQHELAVGSSGATPHGRTIGPPRLGGRMLAAVWASIASESAPGTIQGLPDFQILVRQEHSAGGPIVGWIQRVD